MEGDSEEIPDDHYLIQSLLSYIILTFHAEFHPQNSSTESLNFEMTEKRIQHDFDDSNA